MSDRGVVLQLEEFVSEITSRAFFLQAYQYRHITNLMLRQGFTFILRQDEEKQQRVYKQLLLNFFRTDKLDWM